MTLFDHEALRGQIAARAGSVSSNDIAPVLVARSLMGEESELTADGAVSVRTGAFTGRSPKDKFIVRDSLTEDTVWWDNSMCCWPMRSPPWAAMACSGRTCWRAPIRATNMP